MAAVRNLQAKGQVHFEAGEDCQVALLYTNAEVLLQSKEAVALPVTMMSGDSLQSGGNLAGKDFIVEPLEYLTSTPGVVCHAGLDNDIRHVLDNGVPMLNITDSPLRVPAGTVIAGIVMADEKVEV